MEDVINRLSDVRLGHLRDHGHLAAGNPRRTPTKDTGAANFALDNHEPNKDDSGDGRRTSISTTNSTHPKKQSAEVHNVAKYYEARNKLNQID